MPRYSPSVKEAEQLAIDAQAVANRLRAKGHVEQAQTVNDIAGKLCAVAESMNHGTRTHGLCLFFGRRPQDPFYKAEDDDS